MPAVKGLRVLCFLDRTRVPHPPVLAVVLCASLTVARADLPPTPRLVQETKDLFAEHSADTDLLVREPLAHAQAYLGDFAGAVETLKPIESTFDRGQAIVSCWKINFKKTGQTPPFPAFVTESSKSDDLSQDFLRISAAEELAAAGHYDDAMRLAPKDEPGVGPTMVFVRFRLVVAEKFFDRGVRPDARKLLLQAEDRLPSIPDGLYTKLDAIESLESLWKRLGDKDRAALARIHAHDLLQRLTATSKPSETLAWGWARIGKLHALAAEAERARESFAESARILAEADKSSADRFEPDQTFMDFQGRIAALQFESGFKNDAAKSIQEALRRADRLKDDEVHDYAVRMLTDGTCDVADFQGTLAAVKALRGAYWKSLVICHCASRMLDGGQRKQAEELLAKAEALADAAASVEHATSMYGDIAAVYARAGDAPNARNCLSKASARDVEKDYLQRLALDQIKAGLLDDAYETIKSVEPAKYKLLPMARLARAVARKEPPPKPADK